MVKVNKAVIDYLVNNGLDTFFFVTGGAITPTIDYIGTNSLLCEVEIIDVINEVFKKLRYNDYTIRLNNRKILFAISEALNISKRFNDLCISVDKIDC